MRTTQLCVNPIRRHGRKKKGRNNMSDSDTKVKLREAAQKVFIDESAANLIADELEKMGLHVTQNPNPVSPNELKSGEATSPAAPTPAPTQPATVPVGTVV